MIKNTLANGDCLCSLLPELQNVAENFGPYRSDFLKILPGNKLRVINAVTGM
jgi:hypothetical protein